MFCSSAEIEEGLRCSFCNSNFIDVVKLIPDCGDFICGDCYDELMDGVEGAREFSCKACLMTHTMPKIGLADCRGILRMLKRRKVEKPLSEQATLLKKLAKSIPDQLDSLNSFDDRYYVNQYCDQLEIQAAEEIDRLTRQLNGISKDLLKKINDYRQTRLDSIATGTSVQAGVNPILCDLGSLSDEINAFTAQWNAFFDQVNPFATDDDIEAALAIAKTYETKLETIESTMKKASFRGQTMKFKIHHTLSEVSLKNMFSLIVQTSDVSIQETPSSTLTGHSNAVNHCAFLPDGRLVSCSDDKTIRVWNVNEGTMQFKLTGHTCWVNSFVSLANGWSASCASDHTIKIWDLDQQRLVKTLEGHSRGISCLRVLKNGNLASYSLDNTIGIWDPYTSEKNLLLTIFGHENENWLIPFGVLSDNNLVTCSRFKDNSEDCVLRVWNPSNGQAIKTLSTGLPEVLPILILFNDQVALGFENGTIKIIDLKDDRLSRTKENAHKEAVSSLVQFSNGNLASAGRDGVSTGALAATIKLWKLDDLTLLQKIKTNHSDSINSLAISTDEKLLASGSRDKKIKIWSLSA